MERIQLGRATSGQSGGGLAVNFPSSVLIAAREVRGGNSCISGGAFQFGGAG